MQIKVRGMPITYDDSGGKGIPLLLVHGFPLDRTLWSAQQSLSDVARVIAPDLRGFGGSTLPAGNVSIDTYADDLAGLLDALDIQSAVIAGLSMGGYITLAFQRRHAHRVRALILADTRAGADSADGKKGRDTNITLAREQGVAAIAEKMFAKMLTPKTISERPAVAQATMQMMARQPVAGVIAALGAMRDRPDATPMLGEVKSPTLVVVGADDTLIPPSESEIMAKAIHGAQLKLIPGAAHLANLDAPEEFNRVVREFLKTV